MAFSPGQNIGRGDLDIFLVDAHGNPTQAAEIYYALFYVDPGPPEVEVLIGSAQRTPVNPQIGEYYAALQIPGLATLGNYRIRWYFREYVSQALTEVVQQFEVVEPAAIGVVHYSADQWSMINKLRLLLRDQNPDKFYKFRPPEHEGAIGKYNRVFGQIWEDAELLEYLERSLDWFNMFPPLSQGISTIDMLVNAMPAWRTAILWGAITHACFAMAMNWVADEFDYSIGGVSLTIEKSSKYESLKQNSETMFDKATESKQRTVKFIRGLQQPRFGMGVRSSFGPFVGRGVLSPRSFV